METKEKSDKTRKMKPTIPELGQTKTISPHPVTRKREAGKVFGEDLKPRIKKKKDVRKISREEEEEELKPREDKIVSFLNSLIFINLFLPLNGLFLDFLRLVLASLEKHGDQSSHSLNSEQEKIPTEEVEEETIEVEKETEENQTVEERLEIFLTNFFF